MLKLFTALAYVLTFTTPTGIGYALPPHGHVAHCKTYPAECIPKPGRQAVPLKIAQGVNSFFNFSIIPKREPEGQDIWALDQTEGDCDEYAVMKRHELLNRGFASSSLLLAAVTIPARDEGHLVLLVKTRKGFRVLDNLSKEMKPPGETGYVWRKHQDPADPKKWVVGSPFSP